MDQGTRDIYGGGMKRGRELEDPYGPSKMYKPEAGDGVMQVGQSSVVSPRSRVASSSRVSL